MQHSARLKKLAAENKWLRQLFREMPECSLLFSSKKDMEAWRVHLQRVQDQESEHRLESRRWRDEKIAKLERANAALRGHIGRMKREKEAGR